MRTVSLPSMTANDTPSRNASMAMAVACLAALSFVGGSRMEPEQSTMITWAMSADDTGAAVTPLADTVTIASTSRAPSGRYSFWKTSTANSAVTATPHFDDDHGDVVVPARLQ